jgi:hypothetical protein
VHAGPFRPENLGQLPAAGPPSPVPSPDRTLRLGSVVVADSAQLQRLLHAVAALLQGGASKRRDAAAMSRCARRGGGGGGVGWRLEVLGGTGQEWGGGVGRGQT